MDVFLVKKRCRKAESRRAVGSGALDAEGGRMAEMGRVVR